MYAFSRLRFVRNSSGRVSLRRAYYTAEGTLITISAEAIVLEGANALDLGAEILEAADAVIDDARERLDPIDEKALAARMARA